MGDVINTAKLKEVQADVLELIPLFEDALVGSNSRAATLAVSNIQANAPRNSSDNKPNQVDLYKSFETANWTGRWKEVVQSHAPHAHVQQNLEKQGSWTIPEGDPGVAWIPENPAKWKDKEEVFYDEETGKVVHAFVEHDGVEGTQYVSIGMNQTRLGMPQIFEDEFTDAMKGTDWERRK